MKHFWFILFLLFFVACEDKGTNDKIPVEQDVVLETLVTDLTNPWGLAFLTDGSLLITERPGQILHYDNGAVEIVVGVPDIIGIGQGGMLDIVAHPNFARSLLPATLLNTIADLTTSNQAFIVHRYILLGFFRAVNPF